MKDNTIVYMLFGAVVAYFMFRNNTQTLAQTSAPAATTGVNPVVPPLQVPTQTTNMVYVPFIPSYNTNPASNSSVANPNPLPIGNPAYLGPPLMPNPIISDPTLTLDYYRNLA